MALNLYNPNTGKLLNKGETVTIAGTGRTVTQGTVFDGGRAPNVTLGQTSPYKSGAQPGPIVQTTYSSGQSGRRVTLPGSGLANFDFSALSQPLTSASMAGNGSISLPSGVGGYTGTVGALNSALTAKDNVKEKDSEDPYAVPQDQNQGLTDVRALLTELGLDKKQESVLDRPEYKQAQAQQQELARQVDDYSAQLKSIEAKATADQLSLQGQGRGIPEAIIGGQQAKISREAAIRALPVAALLESAQGRYQSAQSHLDTMYKLISDDLDNDRQFRMDTFNAVVPFMTAQEKRRLELMDRTEGRKYDEAKELEATKHKARSTAMENGAGQTTLNAISMANDLAGVSVAMGAYGVKAAPGFELSAGQTRYDAKGNVVASRPEKGGGGSTALSGNLVKEYGSIVDATANLVGADRGKTTRTAMSSAINRGDYVSAFSQIANNVEESLTGSPKINFADSRTDYAVMNGLRDAVQAYADGGGNMGLIQGTEESIKRKLGIDSGKASELAVQLWREFQVYRLNMTGAAFSPAESRDYAAVNPTLGKSLNLNLSVINGALNQLENRVINTIEVRVPGSKKLYQKVSNAEDGMSDDDAYEAYLKAKK